MSHTEELEGPPFGPRFSPLLCFRLRGVLSLWFVRSRLQASPILQGGFDEIPEERMGIHRLGPKFGMELTSQEPGVVL